MSHCATRLSVLLALWCAEYPSAFTLRRPIPSQVHDRIILITSSSSSSQQRTPDEGEGKAWIDAHVARGLDDVREPGVDDMLESEDLAAFDAHDALDAGMEAAAEERAVMMAASILHDMKVSSSSKVATTTATTTSIKMSSFKRQQQHDNSNDGEDGEWNRIHVARGIASVHEEDDTELRESEESAAWDAHGAPDAGMEAAAEEWGVMLAADLTHRSKTGSITRNDGNDDRRKSVADGWNRAHLARCIRDVREDEMLASEEAAVVDAHDAPDAGIEAAAEERAVMLAAELAHALKEKATALQRQQQQEQENDGK